MIPIQLPFFSPIKFLFTYFTIFKWQVRFLKLPHIKKTIKKVAGFKVLENSWKYTAIMNDSTDRIIEMAWEDRTPFDAIKEQTGYSESEVINIMRLHLKPQSFKRWRKRVQGRKTKHRLLRNFNVGNFKCSRQKSISQNQISKRK